MESQPHALDIGVAGWSYPDWRQTVYTLPAARQQPLLFAAAAAPERTRSVRDPLAFLAGYLDMIEINSTFYRIPAARHAASWCARVRPFPDFHFTAKLTSEFTHRRQRDGALAREYRHGLAPLRQAERLRAILAQFSYDLSNSAEARSLIMWIRGQFADFAPLVVEVRHGSWNTEAGLAFFRDAGIAVADLDYPGGSDAFHGSAAATAERGYLRLHGRNREAWFDRDADRDETYNYDYSNAEIHDLANRGRGLLKNVKHLTIVANNHYRGKAVSAALRLKADLTAAKVPVPPALLATYPSLQAIAAKTDRQP